MLFVLDVSMLITCEGDGNAGVVDAGGVVAISAVAEYVGGTRGSGAMDECGAWDERIWWSVWNVYVFGSVGVGGDGVSL